MWRGQSCHICEKMACKKRTEEGQKTKEKNKTSKKMIYFNPKVSKMEAKLSQNFDFCIPFWPGEKGTATVLVISVGFFHSVDMIWTPLDLDQKVHNTHTSHIQDTRWHKMVAILRWGMDHNVTIMQMTTLICIDLLSSAIGAGSGCFLVMPLTFLLLYKSSLCKRHDARGQV